MRLKILAEVEEVRMKYYEIDTLGDDADTSLAFVDEMISGTGFDMENYRTGLGIPAADLWPADAHVRTRKGGRTLSDLIGTTNSELYVSRQVAERVRAVLSPADQVEFLPLTIRDARGRVLSSDYVVINPLGWVDALDLEASEVTWSKREPGKVVRVDRIVLARAKLDGRAIFRVKEDCARYLIDERLADALREDTTNLFWEVVEVR
jgi:hypothetical protein